MLHRAILLLFAIPGLIQQAAGENQSVFECKHIKASELMRAYAPVVAKEAGAKIRMEGSTVLVTGGGSRLHEDLRGLEPVVDAAKISIATKLIRLHHADVLLAAALISKEFGQEGKGEDALLVVPSPRTKRVFVSGSQADMRTAEVLLLKLDRFCAPASGRGGWRMFYWEGFR